MGHFKQLIRCTCLKSFSDVLRGYIVMRNPSCELKVACTHFFEVVDKMVLDRKAMNLTMSLWRYVGIQKYLTDLKLPMNGIPIEDINDDEGYADVAEAIIIDAYEERSTRYNLDDPAYHF